MQDDPFTADASQMALVHNMFIRAFNSIYLQAIKVRPEDVADFLHYCSAWHMAIKGHHDAEEEVYFPGIEKATGVKGLMDSEISEHGPSTPEPVLTFWQSWFGNLIRLVGNAD